MFALVTVTGTITFTGGLGFAIAHAISGSTVIVPVIVGGVGLAIRAVMNFALDWAAARAGARVKSELRNRVLSAVDRAQLGTFAPGHVATVLGYGIDALDDYFGKFVPQLIATVVVTPVVIVALWFIDPLSGLAVTMTIPLIPLFMILIGWATSATQTRQWAALSSLSTGFADVVEGLSTLQLFGRAERQITAVKILTDEYRVRTMSVLRMSFLSGFALEVGASLSVAVVAVSIGLRLVDGSMDLAHGLWALLLAPEAFLAIRRVGALFHASAEGMTAANDVFALISESPEYDKPNPVVGAEGGLVVDDVAVDGRSKPVSFTAGPGELVALIGPSGSGKSTTLEAIRCAVRHRGHVQWRNRPITPSDIAWSPQGVALIPGTVEDNITMFHGVNRTALTRVTDMVSLELPLDAHVGDAAVAISGGQAARISVARAVYRALTTNARVILLDEPTSSLNEELERHIVGALRELSESGFIVIYTTHRQILEDAADRIVSVKL